MDLVLLLTKIEEAQYLKSTVVLEVGYTTSWEKKRIKARGWGLASLLDSLPLEKVK